MACPPSEVLNKLNYAASIGGAPLSDELKACYNQLNTNETLYRQQYDSGGMYIQAAQSNAASILNPQPGTLPVPGDLVGSIFNLLAQGANAYQQLELAQARAKVTGGTAQLYAPPAVIQQAQKSTPVWMYAAGAGLGLLAVVGLVVYLARKS